MPDFPPGALTWPSHCSPLSDRAWLSSLQTEHNWSEGPCYPGPSAGLFGALQLAAAEKQVQAEMAWACRTAATPDSTAAGVPREGQQQALRGPPISARSLLQEASPSRLSASSLLSFFASSGVSPDLVIVMHLLTEFPHI